MKEILRYSGCFVCGDENDCGLKARFFFDGAQAVSEVTAQQQYEGYRGVFHGGVLATLLDEIMIKAILAQDRFVVTADLSIRFLAPVKIGDRIRFSGRVVRSKGRVFFTEGEARGDDGQTFATATGRYVETKGNLRSLLMQSTD